jgi:uncharacterized protein
MARVSDRPPVPRPSQLPRFAPTLAAMSAPSLKSCVICGKPQAEELAPFCSRRCADVDLNRWLTGVYAVPGAEEDDEDERPDTSRKAGDADNA